ncbi:hypothetical protein [Brevundimonas subvibrioides]|uniref:EF-hand domain-containing protein n=1 Tax=Brevundimonas subvibrioides (strain ATCC 15264 / DSM 4735 / LMG 14903 / NBRC 16000 / CB 81) TaxID=633149 RepID=D9QM06_BRESC|nr:hypothetical protein [Brevundimonas subvibrioides]ADL00090.1 conserved hypothetical protein [Brevundimonas subvibrioides ATCC 15264]
MPAARAEKKTETLEIRLGHAAKSAFMARCRREGVTASDAVRTFIEGQGRSRRARRASLGLVSAVAAGIAGLVVGAAAAPSVAQTAMGASSFARLDRDHDGLLTAAEFAAR